MIIASCLIPFLSFVLVSRGAWLFDFGWQDNWSYVKYFNDWFSRDPILRGFMWTDYKGARVAWVLLGFLAYQALGPLAGALTLHTTVAALSVLVTVGLTARLFGLAAGAAATIIVSAFPDFYSSGHPQAWSYHASIANLFYVVMLWALTEHARAHARNLSALVVGAAGILTLLTATTYVVALPWALAYWAVLRGRPSASEVIDAGRMALIGAAVSVAVLATANTLAGSSPLFVMPLYHLSVYLASRPSFGGPVSMWLPWAVWLALPTIVLIGGSVTALALRMRRLLWSKEARPFVAAFVGFAGLWLTMIALEATIQAYVQYDHFNFMIVGPAALAFGGVLRWLPHRVSAGPSRWPIVAYPLLAILVVVPQALIDPTTVEALSTPVTQKLAAWSLPGAVILGVLAGVVGLGLVATPARYALLLAGLCFGVASAFAVPKQGPFHMAPACHTEQDNFLLVNDVTHWLSSRGLHVTSRSWFPARDVLARPDGCGDFDLYWTYMAIEQAGMLWKLTTPLPERIADLNQGDVRNAAEKERANLVLLSQPGLAEAYKSELATWAQTSRVNPIPRLAETQTFTRGSLSITVQVYRLRQIPRGQARSMPRLPPREGL